MRLAFEATGGDTLDLLLRSSFRCSDDSSALRRLCPADSRSECLLFSSARLLLIAGGSNACSDTLLCVASLLRFDESFRFGDSTTLLLKRLVGGGDRTSSVRFSFPFFLLRTKTTSCSCLMLSGDRSVRGFRERRWESMSLQKSVFILAMAPR